MSAMRTTRAGTRYSPGPSISNPKNKKKKIASAPSEENINTKTQLDELLKKTEDEKRREQQILKEKQTAKEQQQQTLLDNELGITEETYSPKISSEKSSSSNDTAADHEYSDFEDEQMNDAGNDDSFNIITKPSIYIAVAPATNFGGKTPKIKQKIINKRLVGQYENYTGAAPHYYIHQKTEYVQVYFSNEVSLNAFLQEEFLNTDKHPFKFQNKNTVKPIISDDMQKLRDECVIQVVNIPLNVDTPIIRRTFASYGNIVSLQTVTRNAYQQAYIQFDNPDVVKQFHDDRWEVFIFRDTVQVIPKTLSQNKRAQRRDYGVKLAGLPRGTTVHDLRDLLHKVEAKSCFIPRALNTYALRNYAYVQFANKEKLFDAAVTFYQLGDKELRWVGVDTQTCFTCGDPDHLNKDCPERPSRTLSPRQERLSKLYNRYRPAQHRKPIRSYADAVNKNKDKSSTIADQMSDNEKSDILKNLAVIQQTLVTVTDQIKSLTTRIETLETQIKTTDKPAVPPKPSSSTVLEKKAESSNKPNKRVRVELTSSSSGSDPDFNDQLKTLRQENQAQAATVNELRSQLTTITELLQTKVNKEGYRRDPMDNISQI